MRRSLQVRILGVHAAGLIVASVLTLGTVNILLQLRVRTIEHQVLEDQTAGIIQGLSLDATGQLRIDYAETTLAQGGRNTFAFVVRDAANAVRLSSATAPVERLARLRRSVQPRFLTLRRNGPVLSTVTRAFDLEGQRFWIVVAWNLSAPGTVFDDILDGFLAYSTLGTLVVLAVLLGVDLLVVRKSLRPMLRVVQAVRLSHRGGEEYRLGLDELPNEILPMARAYNEALDKVEAAYRLQREFSADAAHELRTPLAVLRARIETLDRSPLRGKLLEDVTVMSRIVAQLLQIASLERLVVERQAAADPAFVCGEVVEALAPTAVAHDQELGLSLPATPPPRLHIDADELFQVVRNLVENAINHTRPGVRIDVAVRADGLVEVADDGPGIPPELHGRVFERFWRRERQTRSGAGLGLAIVQRLVTLHGGSIELQSAADGGCRFLVRLPRAA